MRKALFILLCLPFIGFGQGWEKTFDKTASDIGASVEQTNDGGYIICGTIDHDYTSGMSMNGDVYVIKTDNQGDTIWTRIFGNINITTQPQTQEGNSVQQTTDGGYIICGKYYGPETYCGAIYLIKIDANGNKQWHQIIGGDQSVGTNCAQGFSVQQTNDLGYIITGRIIPSIVGGSWDIYLVKTDGAGIEQWSNTFGGVYDDIGYSVRQTTDGGYIVAGSVYNSIVNNYLDVYLLKTDVNGVQQWNQKFGDPQKTDKGYCAEQTTDGGYIICGSITNNSFVSEMCLIKTNNLGNMIWTKTFSGIGEGRSVQQTIDGGYIIAGTLGTQLHLVKTNNMGLEQWKKIFSGPNSSNSSGYSVKQTTDGGYIIVGQEYSPISIEGWDIFLIKTDGSGNVTSTFNTAINPNRKLQKTVNMSGKQIKSKTNTPLIDIYDDGTVEKRITID